MVLLGTLPQPPTEILERIFEELVLLPHDCSKSVYHEKLLCPIPFCNDHIFPLLTVNRRWSTIAHRVLYSTLRILWTPTSVEILLTTLKQNPILEPMVRRVEIYIPQRAGWCHMDWIVFDYMDDDFVALAYDVANNQAPATAIASALPPGIVEAWISWDQRARLMDFECYRDALDNLGFVGSQEVTYALSCLEHEFEEYAREPELGVPIWEFRKFRWQSFLHMHKHLFSQDPIISNKHHLWVGADRMLDDRQSFPQILKAMYSKVLSLLTAVPNIAFFFMDDHTARYSDVWLNETMDRFDIDAITRSHKRLMKISLPSLLHMHLRLQHFPFLRILEYINFPALKKCHLGQGSRFGGGSYFMSPSHSRNVPNLDKMHLSPYLQDLSQPFAQFTWSNFPSLIEWTIGYHHLKAFNNLPTTSIAIRFLILTISGWGENYEEKSIRADLAMVSQMTALEHIQLFVHRHGKFMGQTGWILKELVDVLPDNVMRFDVILESDTGSAVRLQDYGKKVSPFFLSLERKGYAASVEDAVKYVITQARYNTYHCAQSAYVWKKYL